MPSRRVCYPDGMPGPMEMVVIFVVALLVFGPKKLPELARTLGKGLAEFRRASAELRGSLEREMQNIEHEVKMKENASNSPPPPAALETASAVPEPHEPSPYHDYDPEAEAHDQHEFQR